MTKGISRLTDLNTGLGVNFNNSLQFHTGLVNNRGQVLIHHLGIKCTCQPGNIGDAIIGFSDGFCERCENGFLYRKPAEIMGMITSVGYRRNELPDGFAQPGDCVLSVSPNLDRMPTQFDKLTFTWPQAVNEGEVITRGFLQKKATELADNEDLLFYDAAGAIYVEDEHGKEYFEGSDFTLNGRRIVWTAPIKRNIRYSIKYNAYLNWIVFTPPGTRRDRDVSLGPRYVLRKSHIVDINKYKKTTPIDDIKYGSLVRV